MTSTIVKDHVDYVIIALTVLIETKAGDLFQTHVIRRCYFDTTRFDEHYVDFGHDWEHRLTIENPVPGIYTVHETHDSDAKSYAIFERKI